MASLKRKPKYGNDWTVNDLAAYNITIAQQGCCYVLRSDRSPSAISPSRSPQQLDDGRNDRRSKLPGCPIYGSCDVSNSRRRVRSILSCNFWALWAMQVEHQGGPYAVAKTSVCSSVETGNTLRQARVLWMGMDAYYSSFRKTNDN